jgi:uncharacterized protein
MPPGIISTPLELPPPLPFRPVRWAMGGHLQTLAGWLLPSNPPEPPWERLNLKLPDGDALVIKLARGTSDSVVYLFHGLGGSTDADYMRRAGALFHGAGHTVISVNHRGAGEGRGLAVHPYHGGSSADLAAVIQTGRGFFPECRHLAVGFSLSGNMLLLLLGQGDDAPALPDAAIAVNPPADLEQGSLRLRRGLNRIYDRRFTRRLWSEVEARWEEVPSHRARTLRAFDAAYTAPRAGFQNRDEYYARCSCGPALASITVPTVILATEDDPLAPSEQVTGYSLAPCIHLHVEPTGGHMGYIAKGLPGRRWLEPALDHYVEALRRILRDPGGEEPDREAP